jgi:predicted TPR repeat methyltransferase
MTPSPISSNDKQSSRSSLAIGQWVQQKQRQCIDFLKETYKKLHDLSGTNFELGIYHFEQGHITDAMMRFKITIRFKPSHDMAYYYLGRCYLERNEHVNAVNHFHKALAIQPNQAESHYMLYCLDESFRTENPYHHPIPSHIIQEYFGQIAQEYNRNSIEENGYSLPDYVAEYLKQHVAMQHEIRILDLGCGTGLLARSLQHIHFPPCQMIGVDLSLDMLEQARSLMTPGKARLYTTTYQNEAMQFFNNYKQKLQAIVALQTLHYVGDLKLFFTLIARNLDRDGIALFTTCDIKTTQDQTVINYQLSDNYQYFEHNPEYVTKQIEQSGLQIKHHHIVSISPERSARLWIIHQE